MLKDTSDLLATCVFLLSEYLLSLLNLLFWLADLRQRREGIEVPGDVRIEDRAVMLRHLQRGVSHEFLECKRISSAIHQILPSKGIHLLLFSERYHILLIVQREIRPLL